MDDWRIERVTDATPLLIEAARELFVEYHEWLGEVVCSARLAEEIASLPGPYTPPAGRLLLAFDTDGAVAGVVGVRPLEDARPRACEIKRLYVRPTSRGGGLGRLLAEQAIQVARDLGYEEAMLTTLPSTMETALALYRSLGFTETEPFVDHSHVDEGIEMLYMRLSLRDSR